MEKEDHLFVYGTLCQRMKHPLSHLLVRHGIFIGQGIFQGKLYDLGRYPGAVPSRKKTDLVTGEIYRLQNPKQVFDILDEYEGPRFKRTQVTIFFEEDARLLCWIYIYTHSISGRRIISSGDYVRYRDGS
ncbi:MAG TPA: gamma-glutamylcyclotransferase family protein [Candidatus Acidoferrales bacterium]|nr:gamma-glutamylcyclotransferase family protein [Candidatus Acidoferrales bacterium]